MKTIKIENMKKTRAKRYLFFAGILILICVLMLYNAISKNNFYKNATFEQVQGEVVNIEIEEATDTTSEYYVITLKDQTEPLKLATEYNPDLKKIKDNAKAGDIIELTYDKDLLTIYRAKVGETQLYDIIADTMKSNDNMVVFYIFVAVVAIAMGVVNFITFKKEPNTTEIDYIKYIINNNQAITTGMLKNNSKSLHLIRMDGILNKCLVGAMLIILFIMLLGKTFGENQTLLLIICLCGLALLFVIYILIKPRMYSKHLDTFVNDYIDAIKTGEQKEERTLFLKKEGLKVQKDDKQYFFDYHELNLFAVAAYSKTNAPVNIFICSFLPDKEEYAEVQDFIIPLSRDIYQDIIDNSILVEGFEELFNNLLSECQENIKEVKDGCFVKYYN